MDVIVGSTRSREAQGGLEGRSQDIVNEQSWIIWLPTLNAKVPMRNRFGNAKPSVIPHRLLWNIDRVYVKACREPDG